MKKYKSILYLFLLLAYSLDTSAQNASDSSYAKAVAVYTNTVGVNTHLYNGSEYIDYDHRITGNPFFGSLYFTDGSIVYDDVLYTNVKMFYDILNDDVVIKNYNDTALLLSKEKISSFSFAGHNFIKVTADSAAPSIKSGFYDVLYNGKTKLFAKRIKTITEKIDIQYSESFFSEHNDYYILREDTFYPVNDKGSALHVMKDRKNELTKFIHQEKLKFRKDIEISLIKLVGYYDSLNSNK
jgi:hypothetical protein